MRFLKINQRKNLKKDGELKIYVDDNYEFDRANFEWNPQEIKAFSNDSIAYYTNVSLIMSSGIDSIITNKVDTNGWVKERAHAILIHELVHYLQIPSSKTGYLFREKLVKDMETAMVETNKYVSDPREFEAWTVCSYYYLEKKYKVVLKRIMNYHETEVRKREILINNYLHLAYYFFVPAFKP